MPRTFERTLAERSDAALAFPVELMVRRADDGSLRVDAVE